MKDKKDSKNRYNNFKYVGRNNTTSFFILLELKDINSLTSSGYELGFSCGKTVDHRYSSRFSIARIHAPHSLEDLKNILSGIYPF